METETSISEHLLKGAVLGFAGALALKALDSVLDGDISAGFEGFVDAVTANPSVY